MILVAHRDEISAGPRQRFDQHVLSAVGVLILIDQKMLEPAVDLVADVGVLIEELHVFADQIVEVHGVVFLQTLLVHPVDLSHPCAEKVEVGLFVFGRSDQLVLRV